MPDWSYLPVIRPALLALPPSWAHRSVLRCLHWLTRIPRGYLLIDFLGHMHPPAGIGVRVGSRRWASPIGAAAILDPTCRARNAFARFGFGWIAAGPVGIDVGRDRPVRHDVAARALGSPDPGHPWLDLATARTIRARTPSSVELVFELTATSGNLDGIRSELLRLIESLADGAGALVVSPEIFDRWDGSGDAERDACFEAVAGRARELDCVLLLGVPLGLRDPARSAVLEQARRAGFHGFYIGGRRTEAGMVWSASDAADAAETVTALRREGGPAAILAADAGVQSPRDALAIVDAGADLVALSTGMVHGGPGLPKRCNEALFCTRGEASTASRERRPPERTSWFWAVALGSGMFIGAAMAAWIALTSVLLPYDEAYLGLGSDALRDFNPKILQFMTHDRITLAGTMISIAVLYVAFGYFGIRRGFHWAQRAVVYSALFGFFTFFAFLGFGYLDPFHAFVTTILFQMFLMILITPVPPRRDPQTRDLDNDPAWRWGLRGQLLFVVQAVGLLLAGCVIMGIGMTVVFVETDVGFLGMPPDSVAFFDEHLIPLIAHDRATFGGMLIASGIVLLLGTLWGFRRGDRWQWWAYLLAATPPYLATLWIHHDIGYVNHFHLSPVYIGLGLLVLSLLFSRSYLWDRSGGGARPGPGA